MARTMQQRRAPMSDQLIHIGGQPGCVRRTSDGEIFSVFSLDVVDGRIKTIWLVRNPDKLAHV
jgi:RNA polymerase sigma-70 factor (ECF subfamily)